MKALRWIAWISGAIAVVIIILAGIAVLTGKLIHGIEHGVNYFHVANSFLLITIAIFIATKQCCCCCKDECKHEGEEKKEG